MERAKKNGWSACVIVCMRVFYVYQCFFWLCAQAGRHAYPHRCKRECIYVCEWVCVCVCVGVKAAPVTDPYRRLWLRTGEERSEDAGALSISSENTWTPISSETCYTSARPVLRILMLGAVQRATRHLLYHHLLCLTSTEWSAAVGVAGLNGVW